MQSRQEVPGAAKCLVRASTTAFMVVRAEAGSRRRAPSRRPAISPVTGIACQGGERADRAWRIANLSPRLLPQRESRCLSRWGAPPASAPPVGGDPPVDPAKGGVPPFTHLPCPGETGTTARPRIPTFLAGGDRASTPRWPGLRSRVHC